MFLVIQFILQLFDFSPQSLNNLLSLLNFVSMELIFLLELVIYLQWLLQLKKNRFIFLQTDTAFPSFVIVFTIGYL